MIIKEKIRILLVEDEVNVRETVAEVLRIKGFFVLLADTGKKALEVLKRNTVDLIVSDIMMPEMDGYEFLEELRKRPDTELIPVIFVTAKVDLDDRLKGLERGVNDYITKPFEIKELIARINNLVAERKRLIKRAISEPDAIQVDSEDEVFLKKIKMILEEYISVPELGVDLMAEQLNMSRSTLQKKIKKITNKSVTQFVREFRLKRAKYLLTEGHGNISEVSRKTGFNSVSYFSSSYKNYFGKSPTKLN